MYITGEMSWTLRGIPGSDRIIEYEMNINSLFRDHPISAICQYDIKRFDRPTLHKIINAHPIIITQGGQIMKNSKYTENSILD